MENSLWWGIEEIFLGQTTNAHKVENVRSFMKTCGHQMTLRLLEERWFTKHTGTNQFSLDFVLFS